MCVFCKIIKGVIPSQKMYEDNDIIIIKDINPEAKLHYLMIPKQHFANICEMTEEQSIIMARGFRTLAKLTSSLGLDGGFRLISNKGKDACQSVEHLHVHILGGEQLPERIN